jgi:hypothetical protein
VKKPKRELLFKVVFFPFLALGWLDYLITLAMRKGRYFGRVHLNFYFGQDKDGNEKE